MAPLVSDAPIVVLMLSLVRQMPAGVLAGIRVAGGVFLLYLSCRIVMSFKRREDNETAVTGSGKNFVGRGVWHAAIMNLLNPNPYIFWGTVGAVVFSDGWSRGPNVGVAFLVGMYVMLIGGLALTVLVFGTIGAFGPKVSRVLSLLSAAALAGFGAMQLWSAIA